MKFGELVRRFHWEAIEAKLLGFYPGEEPNSPGYKAALEEIKSLEPVKSRMMITIEKVVDKDGTWWDVSGRDGTKYSDCPEFKDELENPDDNAELNWALDYSDWAEWLDMEIDPGALAKFGELGTLALCLYEMTFVGYSRVDVNAAKKALERMADEYDRKKKDESDKV